MGCDIHLHVEVMYPDGIWSHLLSPYCPRDYVLFGYLAGVRYSAPHPMEPKGFPEDADYTTIEHYTTRIVEDEAHESCNCGYGPSEIVRSKAEEYIKKGYAQRVDEKRIVGLDWHTPSHLNFWEFELQLSRAEKDASRVMLEYRALLNYMNTFESVDKRTRIVFWFDN